MTTALDLATRTASASQPSFPRRRESIDPIAATPTKEGNPTVMHSQMDPRLRGDDGMDAFGDAERERAVTMVRKPPKPE